LLRSLNQLDLRGDYHFYHLLLTKITNFSILLKCFNTILTMVRFPVELPPGPFEATWDSLRGYRVAGWFRYAKFGVFIHWGVYSVPACCNEWYPRNMYIQGSREFKHHIEHYGPHDKFGYKDFIPMFTADKWDPNEWCSLFKSAGAKYVVPVAEHHDGFSMWDSSINRWNAKRMGPGRDVIGELAKACRDEGLIFGVSYHRAEHWWFFEGGRRFNSDVNDPNYSDLYGPATPIKEERVPGHPWPEPVEPPNEAFLNDWLLRAIELVDKYRPQLFYFDWWVEYPSFEPYLRFFTAYYYNRASQWGVEVVVNYKHNAMPEGAGVLDVERGKLDRIRPLPWQTDTSVCLNTWGFTNDCQYRPVDSIIHDLIDIVSKNGNLLLNIAPRADGTIPEEQVKMLNTVGEWLSVNGDAVYGSTPWVTYGEGPTRQPTGEFKETEWLKVRYTGRDWRFTRKGNAIYAAALDWPGEEAVIQSLGANLRLLEGEVEEVELLGYGKLSFTRDERGLVVKMPNDAKRQPTYVLRIKVR